MYVCPHNIWQYSWLQRCFLLGCNAVRFGRQMETLWMSLLLLFSGCFGVGGGRFFRNMQRERESHHRTLRCEKHKPHLLAVMLEVDYYLKKSACVLNCFLWWWEAREEFLVLALFSSELCNYLNPVHTRPYPELGNRRGIHRFVHLAIVVWAVTGHCWGPHTGFTHSKFRHSHLPWKSAITHPVPQLGRPENIGGGH